jgi:hypothetical protein
MSTGSIACEPWQLCAQLISHARIGSRCNTRHRGHRRHFSFAAHLGACTSNPNASSSLTVPRLRVARSRSNKRHRPPRLHEEPPRFAAPTPLSHLQPHVLRSSRDCVLPAPAPAQHVRLVRRTSRRRALVRGACASLKRVSGHDQSFARADSVLHILPLTLTHGARLVARRRLFGAGQLSQREAMVL